MATFPVTLPAPQMDGYDLAPVDQTARTDMEVGAARQRRRTAARQDKVRASWKFTDAQMDIFRAWFDNSAECAGGAAWFTISLAVGATGIDSKSARFIGAFQAKLLPGLIWHVSATLEVQ